MKEHKLSIQERSAGESGVSDRRYGITQPPALSSMHEAVGRPTAQEHTDMRRFRITQVLPIPFHPIADFPRTAASFFWSALRV